jgi:hypothetical protein
MEAVLASITALEQIESLLSKLTASDLDLLRAKLLTQYQQ